MQSCARCGQPVTDAESEACAYCEGTICGQCWEAFGVCCPAGDAFQAELSRATTDAERRAVMARLGPIGKK